MRALLKDKEDQTLIVIEVTEAVYDPKPKMLYLRNADAGYQVERIVKPNADSALQTLYEEGKVDLTNFPACAEEE